VGRVCAQTLFEVWVTGLAPCLSGYRGGGFGGGSRAGALVETGGFLPSRAVALAGLRLVVC
jgi:hypothetical protein